MAESELNIILKLKDEASAQIKKVSDEAGKSVSEVGNKSAEASGKMKSFNDQIKDASSKFREMRRTALLATAALATVIATTREAAEYNEQSKKSFDEFSIAVKSFSVLLGQILEPALQFAT